jgi:phenylacetate-CoA ligase
MAHFETSKSNNQVARFAEVLRGSQWASPDQIFELQHRLIERLVRHAAAETEAYAERLAPVLDAAGRFDMSRWDEILILDRSDLQDRQAGLRARSVPPESGGIVPYATSGSTGRPMEFVKSGLLTASSRAIVERAQDWADVDRDLPYATIAIDRAGNAPPPDGHFRTGWSWMGGTGKHGFLAIEATIEVQAAFLDRLRPAYIKTYPTNAAALAEFAGGRDWHSNLRHLFTFAETLTDHHVETIRERLGVDVIDFYASEESGQMATRCPHSGHYHVAAESVLLEVIRDDGEPAGPGETGRVIVTPFYNYALPLIRYEQGDYVEVAEEPCGCGRTLPTLKRILGRSRDMFVLPDGDRIWPRLPPATILEFLPARQWQVVQVERDLIEMRFVHDGSQRQPDEAAFAAHVRSRYGEAMRTRLVRMDRIERTPGGKFREFISLVA